MNRQGLWFFSLYVMVAISTLLLMLPQILRYTERDLLTYPDQPFKVLNTPVRHGEELKVQISRCNWSSGPLSYMVQGTLIHLETGQRRRLPPVRWFMMTGGCETQVTIMRGLPEAIPPGHYMLEGISSVSGRWKTSDVAFATESFELVVSKDDEEK